MKTEFLASFGWIRTDFWRLSGILKQTFGFEFGKLILTRKEIYLNFILKHRDKKWIYIGKENLSWDVDTNLRCISESDNLENNQKTQCFKNQLDKNQFVWKWDNIIQMNKKREAKLVDIVGFIIQ